MTELVKNINEKILFLRGKQVMLDRDLAEFYMVQTKVLNQTVKRNKERFPRQFMFQLNEDEVESLRSQFVTLETGRGKHRKYLPYAFTEQGVAMLAGILRSDKAVKVSIEIINAFVLMRNIVKNNSLIDMRLVNLEKKQLIYDSKLEEIYSLMNKNEVKEGIFFDGQVFDAYNFVSDLIRSAKSRIILMDNYVDDSVLTLFRKSYVDVIIYTKKNSILKLDLEKYNSQYSNLKVKEFDKCHDRFLIIDNEVYHIGASLKDLGRKWFAFSKMSFDSFEFLDKLK